MSSNVVQLPAGPHWRVLVAHRRADVRHVLRTLIEADHVAIVGHEPGLSGLVALLLTGSAEGLRLVLKKGGVVALEVRDPGRRGAGTMRWLLTPRQLRRLGRRPRI